MAPKRKPNKTTKPKATETPPVEPKDDSDQDEPDGQADAAGDDGTAAEPETGEPNDIGRPAEICANCRSYRGFQRVCYWSPLKAVYRKPTDPCLPDRTFQPR